MEPLKSYWSSFYEKHEAELSRHYPGLNISRFLMEVKDIINKNINVDVKELEDAFLKGVPFAYLLENAEFYYQNFYINTHVLIPRPETEYLVDIIVNDLKGKVKHVLDVGTGSGVILLSLLKAGVGESGVGLDISEEALKVAQVNAARFGIEDKVKLLQSDRLKNVEGTFDLIVSNPPYIKASSHKHLVHEGVDTYEPHEALYLPDDLYASWFEVFFKHVRSHLKGTFYMEGHELELDEQAKQLTGLGFQNVEVLKDLTQTKRFLKASF